MPLPANVSAAPLTVLVAEDDRLIQGVLRAMLQRYSVTFVSSTGEALAALASSAEPFAAVVTDLKLPGAGDGGVSVARAARARGVPCILAMGGDDRDAPRVLEAGAERFFLKPFSLVDLVKTLPGSGVRNGSVPPR